MAAITNPAAVPGAKTVLPIPPLVKQVGATCGLYALSCVIRYWHQLLTAKGQAPAWSPPTERGPQNAKTLREKLNDEIKARAGKPSANPTPFTGVTTPTNLLEIAETLGSRIGEVFEAEALAQIALKAGLYAYTERWTDETGFWELVREHIDRNVPCIIGYDNTDTGDPGTTTFGSRAHWAVLFGYVEKGTGNQVLATHGWGNYYLWDAATLRRSNEQVFQFGRWGTWYRSEDTKGAVNWHGPGVPAVKSATPADLPDNVNTVGAKPVNAVAGFHIGHEIDLMKQMVIVLPRKVLDYSAPTTAKTSTVATTGGGGHHF